MGVIRTFFRNLATVLFNISAANAGLPPRAIGELAKSERMGGHSSSPIDHQP